MKFNPQTKEVEGTPSEILEYQRGQAKAIHPVTVTTESTKRAYHKKRTKIAWSGKELKIMADMLNVSPIKIKKDYLPNRTIKAIESVKTQMRNNKLTQVRVNALANYMQSLNA
jgi:hypothetical protein